MVTRSYLELLQMLVLSVRIVPFSSGSHCAIPINSVIGEGMEAFSSNGKELALIGANESSRKEYENGPRSISPQERKIWAYSGSGGGVPRVRIPSAFHRAHGHAGLPVRENLQGDETRGLSLSFFPRAESQRTATNLRRVLLIDHINELQRPFPIGISIERPTPLSFPPEAHLRPWKGGEPVVHLPFFLLCLFAPLPLVLSLCLLYSEFSILLSRLCYTPLNHDPSA